MPLGTAEPGHPHFSYRKNPDALQGIKGAFSAVFDALSKFTQEQLFFIKKSAPFFCGITRDYCL